MSEKYNEIRIEPEMLNNDTLRINLIFADTGEIRQKYMPLREFARRLWYHNRDSRKIIENSDTVSTWDWLNKPQPQDSREAFEAACVDTIDYALLKDFAKKATLAAFEIEVHELMSIIWRRCREWMQGE